MPEALQDANPLSLRRLKHNKFVRKEPVLVTLAPLARRAVIVILLQTAALFATAQSPTPSLDFEYYRTRVEPIFLKKRPGHARCVVCHAGSNNAFRLQPLPAGSTTWTEEQSRQNFEIVSRLVTPGDPASSRLLLHPLSPEAGGDRFHSGGRQFASQNDPDWRVLADWVGNTKTNASTTP
jgi:hypothetical protein